MAEPIKKKAPATETTPPKPAPATDADAVIKQIEDIKKGMVSKEKYEKILSERNKFRDAIISGAKMEEEENKTRETHAELVKKMSQYNSGNVTNLEYIETALKLREATILEKGIDPFENAESPEGFGQRVADGLKDMVEEADGRPEAFLGIYQAGTKDEKIMKPKN